MSTVRGRLYAFALPLLTPLQTAHGVVAQREGFLVELLDEAGEKGYGEAAPLPSFGAETSAACEAALRSALTDRKLDDGVTAPVAQCAIECARLDLEARGCGTSFTEALERASADAPAAQSPGASVAPGAGSVDVNALVGGSDAEAISRDLECLAPSGFKTWKLKVGVASLEDDVARVRALRDGIGTEGRIRLDANGVWTASAARAALDRFAASEIELIEQPLAPGDPSLLAGLRRDSPIRIAADESIVDCASLRALLDAEAVDAVALKLPVLGGAVAALELGREAQRRGVGVYVTSFLDSSLGIAAALHVASLLSASPLQGSGLAHGLATASLLARDLVGPAEIALGKMRVPRGPGLGAAPQPTEIAQLGEPIAEVRG